MTTAIIGTGNIGEAVARHLVEGGERVVLAAHDESHATALAKELGELASATSVEKAITDADVVVFAAWLDTLKDLIAQHADLLRGIETSGDLHQFGGLNGRVLDAGEARTALAAAA